MKIEIISYGQHQAELAGCSPIAPTGRYTLFQQFELRVLPDPAKIPEFKSRSGLETDVTEYVLASQEAKVLLPTYWAAIQGLLTLAERQRFTGARFAFMCGGGFQRSVAVALFVFRKLQEEYPEAELSIRHLGLEKRGLVEPPHGCIRGIIDTIPA